MRHAPRPAAKKKREEEDDDDEDEFEGEDGLSPQQARRDAGLEQGVATAAVRGECPLVWSISDGHIAGEDYELALKRRWNAVAEPALQPVAAAGVPPPDLTNGRTRWRQRQPVLPPVSLSEGIQTIQESAFC